MVYNIGGAISFVGAKIKDEKITKLVGNPIFLLIAISTVFMIILAVATYKSSYTSKWKAFSVYGLITLSSVSIIIFLHKYMERKTLTSFSGGGNSSSSQSHKIPNIDFFSLDTTVDRSPPQGSFDELFNDI